MSSKSKSGGLLTGLLALAFMGLLAIGVGTYAMGWMTIESGAEITTVEVKTGEMKRSADEAAKAGRKLLNGAAEEVENAADNVEQAVSNDPEAVDAKDADDRENVETDQKEEHGILVPPGTE